MCTKVGDRMKLLLQPSADRQGADDSVLLASMLLTGRRWLRGFEEQSGEPTSEAASTLPPTSSRLSSLLPGTQICCTCVRVCVHARTHERYTHARTNARTHARTCTHGPFVHVLMCMYACMHVCMYAMRMYALG